MNGFLTNLKNGVGVTSGVGLTVNNGDGLWGYASSDLMAASYIYSLSPDSAVQTRVTVTNLPAGTYNFYLYGGDSQFNLKVGATDYGTKVSLDDPIINPPPWVEGHQYVRFSNVLVGASQTALISLGAGQFYYQGIIGGMQIESVPEPSCAVLLSFAGLILACRARKENIRLTDEVHYLPSPTSQSRLVRLSQTESNQIQLKSDLGVPP